MGDVVKWGLLVVGILLLITMVTELPFLQFLKVDELSSAVTSLVDICGSVFRFARGLINLFFTEFGRGAVTGLIVWVITKPFVMQGIQWLVYVYHYIFK